MFWEFLEISLWTSFRAIGERKVAKHNVIFTLFPKIVQHSFLLLFFFFCSTQIVFTHEWTKTLKYLGIEESIFRKWFIYKSSISWQQNKRQIGSCICTVCAIYSISPMKLRLNIEKHNKTSIIAKFFRIWKIIASIIVTKNTICV